MDPFNLLIACSGTASIWWVYQKHQTDDAILFRPLLARLTIATILFLLSLGIVTFFSQQLIYIIQAQPVFIVIASLAMQYWVHNRFLNQWISTILLVLTFAILFFTVDNFPSESTVPSLLTIHLALTAIGIPALIIQYCSEQQFLEYLSAENSRLIRVTPQGTHLLAKPVTEKAFAYYTKLGINTRALLYRALDKESVEDIAPQDSWIATMLLATIARRPDIVNILLKMTQRTPVVFQKMLSYADKDGNTPLVLAAKTGLTETVGALLEAAKPIPTVLVDILNQTNLHQYTALISAAYRGHTETVQLILERAATQPGLLETILNHATPKGHTALTLAAQQGHTPSIQALLKAAAFNPALMYKLLNHTTQDGFTALIWAATCGRIHTIHALAESVSSEPVLWKNMLMQVTKKGHTALTLAAQQGHTETVRVLLAAAPEADTLKTMVTHIPQNGLTAMTGAMYTSTVGALLEVASKDAALLRAMLTHATPQGYTALTQAARCGHTNRVRMLLETASNDADLFREILAHTAQDGLTALGLAARNGFADTVCLLLLYGADWESSGIPQSEQADYEHALTYQSYSVLGEWFTQIRETIPQHGYQLAEMLQEEWNDHKKNYPEIIARLPQFVPQLHAMSINVLEKPT